MALFWAFSAPAGQVDTFSQAGSEAAGVGTLLVDNLLSREYMMYGDEALHYSEAATAVGALRFSSLNRNSERVTRIIERYSVLLNDNSPLVSRRGHVDMNVIGIIPLQIAILTGDEAYLDLGLSFADSQWENPRDDGLTGQTRWWIDDLYMVGMLQIQAFRATGDAVYANRAAQQLASYLPRLQQANGLFHHGPEAPIFWGRGNGWVASAMAEVLADLPADQVHRDTLVTHFRIMMEALLDYQGEDGMWRQIIDDEQAWPESSSTAMFAYAMAVGLTRDLLEGRAYEASLERAWPALVGLLDADGNLAEVCVGTGKSIDPAYYLSRQRVTGDFHGQAPMLWLSTQRLENSKAGLADGENDGG